jgi:hypothetical protein
MTGHFILADMTSHRRGFGVQCVFNATARRTQTNPSSSKILWLVPSHLTAAFGASHGLGNGHEVRNCDAIGPLLWPQIRSELERIKSTTPETEITVVTWDPFIFAKVREYGQGVVAMKWINLINDYRGPNTGRAARPQQLVLGVQIPTLEQLRENILSYLKSIGATSAQRAIYRSQLRPAVERIVADLRLASSHPQFASTFKMALDTAINSKLIAEECLTPGKERLWVSEPVSLAASVPQAATQAIPQASAQDEGKAAASGTTNPTYERSAQFRKRLTDLGIFCEKRERDLLMEATEQLLKAAPMTISRLRRELPKTAKEIADQRGLCTGTDFRRIVNFFLKLLLVSGTLTCDGGIVKRDAGAEAASATGLVKNAIDAVETYLLEQILKKSDVKDREHWQLAMAIFREFDPSISMDDKLDRIASLISNLSQRVILTEDGTYEYTGNTSAGPRAIRAQA